MVKNDPKVSEFSETPHACAALRSVWGSGAEDGPGAVATSLFPGKMREIDRVVATRYSGVHDPKH